MPDDKAAVLVVAHYSAQSDELFEAVTERAKEGRVHFVLLVPATPAVKGIPEPVAADMEGGHEQAEPRLEEAVERMREAGLDIEGRLGDPDPVAAVEDQVNVESFDEVIVCSPTEPFAQVAKMNLPRRVEGSTGLPVKYVKASEKETGQL